MCDITVRPIHLTNPLTFYVLTCSGKGPYPNVAVDTNFYKMIKDGRHMAQPDFAPAEMCENRLRLNVFNANKVILTLTLTCPLRYQLMTLCWSLEPTDRPTFKTIGQLINRLLPSTNDTSPRHGHQVRTNQSAVHSAPTGRLLNKLCLFLFSGNVQEHR